MTDSLDTIDQSQPWTSPDTSGPALHNAWQLCVAFVDQVLQHLSISQQQACATNAWDVAISAQAAEHLVKPT